MGSEAFEYPRNPPMESWPQELDGNIRSKAYDKPELTGETRKQVSELSNEPRKQISELSTH